jgi:hypothetical protein
LPVPVPSPPEPSPGTAPKVIVEVDPHPLLGTADGEPLLDAELLLDPELLLDVELLLDAGLLLDGLLLDTEPLASPELPFVADAVPDCLDVPEPALDPELDRPEALFDPDDAPESEPDECESPEPPQAKTNAAARARMTRGLRRFTKILPCRHCWHE